LREISSRSSAESTCLPHAPQVLPEDFEGQRRDITTMHT
jgi:hypothetical protein